MSGPVQTGSTFLIGIYNIDIATFMKHRNLLAYVLFTCYCLAGIVH